MKTNKYPWLLVFIVFLVYGNTLWNEYALDDAIVITENAFTKRGIEGIPDIFSHDSFTGFFGKQKKLVAGGRYRPFSIATFALEIEFFGMGPAVHHAVNILLYTLLCFLLYKLMKRIAPREGKNRWAGHFPFFTVLVFALHPIHTEVVANIKGRDEILAMVGGISSLLFILRYLDQKKKHFLVLAFFLFLMGVFSKEIAVVFLALAPLFVWYFYPAKKYRDGIMAMLPLGLAALVYLAVRQHVLGGQETVVGELMNNPFLHAKAGEKSATVFFTLALYLKLLFFPHPLTFDYYPYHIELVGWDHPVVIFSVAVYLFLVLFAMRGLVKKDYYSLATWIHVIPLLLVANILFPVGTFMSERFLFIPSWGFAWALAYLMTFNVPAWVGEKAKILVPAFFVLVSLVYGAKVIQRNKVWKDDFSLFTRDVNISSNSAKSNTSAGGILLEKAAAITVDDERQEYYQRAIRHLEKAIEIHPRYYDALLLLGNAYLEYKDNYQAAYEMYQKAIQVNPGKEVTFGNLAILFGRVEEPDWEIPRLEKVLKLRPDNYAFNYELGRLYGRYKQDIPRAIKYLEKAAHIKPNRFNAHKDLGVAYGIAGNFNESEIHLKKALDFNPGDVQSLKNLIITLQRLGKQEEAREWMEKVRGKE